MRITKHGENLWQLTRLRVMNCYLVAETDGFTLIDTGISGSAQQIIDAAAAQGGEIKRIVLTHPHDDHTGSLDELVAALPDAELLLTERTAKLLAGDKSLRPDEPQAKLRGGYPTRSAKPTRTIAPNDLVGSLRAIASPGHTPDHVSYYDERDGTLIAGDAFHTQGRVAVAGTLVWRFPFPAFATWHRPTAIESAGRLVALSPTRLATGHGPVIEAPLSAMRNAVDQASVNAAKKG